MNAPLSVAAFPIAKMKVSGAGARKTDLGQVSLSFTSQRQRDFIEVRNASYARGIDAILLSSSPLVAVLTRYGLPERNGEFPPLLRPGLRRNGSGCFGSVGNLPRQIFAFEMLSIGSASLTERPSKYAPLSMARD